MKCIHCETYTGIKHGKTSAGSQRYRCKECGTTYTSSTKYNEIQKSNFINVELPTTSVRKLAIKVGVAPTTILRWKKFYKYSDAPVEPMQLPSQKEVSNVGYKPSSFQHYTFN